MLRVTKTSKSCCGVANAIDLARQHKDKLLPGRGGVVGCWVVVSGPHS